MSTPRPLFSVSTATILTFLTAVLASVPVVRADTGCFVVKGRQLAAHAGMTASSGRMAPFVQHGNWDTRPMVRVVLFGPFGAIEAGHWSPTRYLGDIVMNVNTVFVTGDYGLFSLDLSQPFLPRMLGYVNLVDAEHLALDGSYVYTATTGHGSSWFDIVDVSDPENMVPRGQLTWNDPDLEKHAIEAKGSVVVIADDAGLQVLDVSDPDNPIESGRWSGGAVVDLALVDSPAVLALASTITPGTPGVTVLDLSDPANPAPVGQWHAPSTVLSMAEYGDEVVVGTATDGIFLLNIDDPAHPEQVDHWNELGLVDAGVSATWPTITVSSAEFGLTILGLAPECLAPRMPSGRSGR